MGKISNAAIICRYLWQNPMESRAAIAKSLGLDKATVTVEVASLIKDKKVLEMPALNTLQTGRRPIPLRLNGDYGMALGLAIQAGLYTVAAVNLNNEVLFSATKAASIDKDNLISMVKEIYFSTVECHKNELPPCLGLSIGVGGLVCHSTKSLDFSVPLKVDDKHTVVEPLEKELGVEVLLENNANCCAWLNLLPVNKGPSDFIYLMLEFNQILVPHDKYGGIGIGLGIVIDGKLHRGSHSYAGEFRSAFCEGVGDSQMSLSKEEMARLLEDREVFERFSHELAQNIAMLSNTMDLGCIYVGSDCEKPGKEFCKALEVAISQNWLFPIAKKIPIVFSSIGASSVAVGAAECMFLHLFDNQMI